MHKDAMVKGSKLKNIRSASGWRPDPQIPAGMKSILMRIYVRDL